MTRFSVHPSMLLWLSVLFYLRPRLVLPFLGAVLFHELGHFLALCMMKKRPLWLSLTFVGASMETTVLSYRQTIWAAGAGPLFSLLLGLLFPLTPILSAYSLLLGLFNLLPMPGLDGGKILESFLYLHLSPSAAGTIAAWIGLFFALLLCAVAVAVAAWFQLGVWPVALAAVFLFKAMDAWK